MSDDLISRQEAIDAALNDNLILNAMDSVKDGDIHRTKRAIVRLLASLPSKQPDRKVGRWEVYNVVDYAQRPTGRRIGRCPFCGYLTNDFRTRVEYYRNMTHFCANCGADMEGNDGRDPGRL